MFINQANAASVQQNPNPVAAMTSSNAASTTAAPITTTTATTAVPAPGAPTPPSEREAFIMNIGMLIVLGILFYLLMVRPQKKRFMAHNSMLQSLGVGSKIVTQGGLVGTIEKIVSDQEVQIEISSGVKVNLMRSYITGLYDPTLGAAAANDLKSTSKDNKSAK
ncbi:MAG: preprotein translocase subunit YajC [Alphaproteobacteria bacterium]|nr:preprotein translocase subunit YajC [Alphaproteobacteria bacterium]